MTITDAASGHFVVNGVAQGANLAINVIAGQLAQASFQLGMSGTDDLMVRASDGFAWGAWKLFHVSAAGNHAPVVSAVDLAPAHGQTSLAASSLFSASDADHDAITRYQFWDATPTATSGHFVVNGVAQGANLAINVIAAQLAQTSFQLGTSEPDDLMVRASDGTDWGAWKEFHVSPLLV